MPKESLQVVTNRNIFSPTGASEPSRLITSSYAVNNIDNLFPSAQDDLQKKIEEQYQARGGTIDYTRNRIGVAVPVVTQEIINHTQYIGDVIGRRFEAVALASLYTETYAPNVLLVPYIHNHEAQRKAQALGQESWGLHPKMVEHLVDKQHFHELVDATDVSDVEVPEYKIATRKSFIAVSQQVLKESDEMYQQYDPDYPRGLMIRPANADGQYGSSKIVQKENGDIVVTVYGKEKRKTIIQQNTADKWEKALQTAQAGLESNMAADADPNIVVSRFVELADTPGLSLIVRDGHVMPLGWNGQIMKAGDTACEGTSTYNFDDDPTLAQLQAKYEQPSIEASTAFTEETARKLGIPFEELNGKLNYDVMIPGPREAALRKARGKKDGFYFAESNPRWTNFTDGVMASIGFLDKKPTVADMRDVLTYGIRTIDKQEVPPETDHIKLREIIFDRDQSLARSGDARVIVRMPGIREIGVILLGDQELAQKELNEAIKNAKS